MKKVVDTGGPAFPNDGLKPDSTHASMSGMSLRDWFAGMAACGMLADYTNNPNLKALSESAYQTADAMIAEKRRTENGK